MTCGMIRYQGESDFPTDRMYKSKINEKQGTSAIGA